MTDEQRNDIVNYRIENAVDTFQYRSQQIVLCVLLCRNSTPGGKLHRNQVSRRSPSDARKGIRPDREDSC